ncbi:MAG: hypothetical protein V4525_10400 [Pseudomonadota bacterium]
MQKVNTLFFAISTTLLTGAMSYAFATDCVDTNGCDTTINTTTTNTTINNTKNTVTTTFSNASAESALRLQSVYQTVGSIGQNNSGDVYARGYQDDVITTKKGDVKIGVTAIGNNVSAELIGLKSVNLSIAQKNSGDITADNAVLHPHVGGNMEVTTSAIGNNASVGWDLTTDKHPSDNAFDVKRDGALRSLNDIGTFVGSVEQCNTGDVTAVLAYRQDPAANIQISTTAIGNNLSFGVKTR